MVGVRVLESCSIDRLRLDDLLAPHHQPDMRHAQMCMIYFLGCEGDAPLTAPWSEASPSFYVAQPESHQAERVRAHLPFPCIRSLGAHTGCGCGFRCDWAGPVDTDPEETAAAQADHDALARYLSGLPPQRRRMQIYGCWYGDEAKRPEHHRSISIAELASPEFVFHERELITLTS